MSDHASPFPMQIGGRDVARGSDGNRIIVTAKGEASDDTSIATRPVVALAIGTPDPDCPASLLAVHNKTPDELLALLREWDENPASGHPTAEKCVAVRTPENINVRSGLIMPELSETRQNRYMLLATGPDAKARMRLRRPLPDGDTKKEIELLPGDMVETGIYACGEVPVEMLLRGREVIIFNARDITQVIRSQELDKLYAEADVPPLDVTPSKEDAHG